MLRTEYVELCTIPSYLNYILLYSAWLYKPARIHYILFQLRLDCPRVLDCIPGCYASLSVVRLGRR
jgi:hypothetical protein